MKLVPSAISGRVGTWISNVRTAAETSEGSARVFALLRRFFAALSPTVFALLLSARALPLSTFPFGIALVAAAGGDTLYFAAGTALSALLAGRLPLLFSTVALLLVRLCFFLCFTPRAPLSVKGKLHDALHGGDKPFSESETLRVASAALGGFTVGMLQLLYGGLTLGDFLGACLTTLLCPILAYLYTGCFAASERDGIRYDLGLCALLASLVFALSPYAPLGISLSVITAALITFLLARYKNPFTACLFATVAVLASEPLLAPAFGLSAAVAALLFAHSPLYAVSVSAIVFAALSYFVGGLSVFADSFPEYLFGILLSLPIPKAKAKTFLPFTALRETQSAQSEILTYKEQRNRERVRDLSEAFESLSRTFFDLSDRKRRIGLFDTREICDRVCDRVCKHCEACTLCWERDYAVTVETLNKISVRLYKSGEIRKSDLPEAFLARCKKVDRLIDGITAENRRALEKLVTADKTREFAVDYGVFAKVLTETLEKNEAEFAPNAPARKKVREALAKIGFFADSIGVYGSRCKCVYAFRLRSGALQSRADEIKAALSEALGGKVEDPLFEFADGGIHMTVRAAPNFRAEISTASRASDTGEENGDRVSAFSGKNAQFYALISDGMGSGETAARKSSAATLFLEKMLRAGNSVTAGLEMLGALTRVSGEESFTTLDLFELDEITGTASFIKSGAASSFVRRGNRLFRIRSGTLPVGILPDVDAERTSFVCEDGDIVVMLSDGVTEEIEEPVWLCEFLTRADLSAPDAAKKILDEARTHTLCRDDMTAAVIKIGKAG